MPLFLKHSELFFETKCQKECTQTREGIGIPKYQKYREIPKFNSIEYRKCSIPNFQYYWILKKFQYWSSILPKVSVLVPKIPKCQMSLILRNKILKKFKKYIFFQNFQYSWIFSVFFSIFRDSIPKMFDIEKKNSEIYSDFFAEFFRIFRGFSVFLGIFGISGLPNIWVLKFQYWTFSIFNTIEH